MHVESKPVGSSQVVGLSGSQEGLLGNLDKGGKIFKCILKFMNKDIHHRLLIIASKLKII